MSHAKQRKTSHKCAAAVMTVAGLATALLAVTDWASAQSPGVPTQPRSAPGLSGAPSGIDNPELKPSGRRWDNPDLKPSGRSGIEDPDMKPGGKLRVPSQLK